MSFPDALAEAADLVAAGFADLLDSRAGVPVRDAMDYALRGGKRLRGFLVLESARLHRIGPERAVFPAMAVEALHAYSLVHDDLPCMDDDDLRRGQPTVHKVWDEATAVLAGDALQTLAFECLARPETGPAEVRIDLVAALAQASGIDGMVLGQALDIAAETAAEPLDLAAITRLQQAKTGALIQFAATAGAVMAGEDPGPLAEYARNLGLAFQIQDDILDVTGTEAETGKRTGKDGAANKATFVSLLGLEGARDKARALVRDAEAALDAYGEGAGNLRQLARFVIERDA